MPFGLPSFYLACGLWLVVTGLTSDRARLGRTEVALSAGRRVVAVLLGGWLAVVGLVLAFLS
jgi:hypothetical protein